MLLSGAGGHFVELFKVRRLANWPDEKCYNCICGLLTKMRNPLALSTEKWCAIEGSNL
jgi:hypothetical protein